MSLMHDLLGSLDGVRTVDFYLCWKSAEAVRVIYYPATNLTWVSPYEGDGTINICTFKFNGNPFRLSAEPGNPYVVKDYPVVPGGTSPAPAAAAAAPVMLDRLIYGHGDGEGDFEPLWVISGMTPFSTDALISILTDLTGVYERFVALLDDDTVARGTEFADEIEVGAGDDFVRGFDGNDIVTKWRPGDLTYNGGDGIDKLSFWSELATFGFSPLVEQLVIDLGAGTGRNPYGGALTLKSVEVVSTINGAADIVFGSGGAETVGGGFANGDVYTMRGGDDLVNVTLTAGEPGLTVDGGGGIDTVAISEFYVPSVLDLGNDAANTGVFAGSSFDNVELFRLSARLGNGGTLLTLKGTSGDDDVGFFAYPYFANPIAAADMRLGGGDDRGHGGGGADSLFGGNGDDTLSGGNPSNPADGTDRLYGGDGRDLLGGGTDADRLFGGAAFDTLTGGAGDDTMTGAGGRDRFVFVDGFGDDRMTDFVPDRDRLDFRGHSGIDSFDDLRFADRAAGALVKDGVGNTVLLLGVAVADLTEADFLI